MKVYFSIIFYLISVIGSNAQSELFKAIPVPTDQFYVDNEENIYFTHGAYFYKSSPPYLLKKEYLFNKNKDSYFIDISNPDNILIFFHDYQKLIILDSMLNEPFRPFYLDELGMSDILFINSNKKKEYWFYNLLNNSIYKLDVGFLPVVKDKNLDIFFNRPKAPTFMHTCNEKLFINVPSAGIFIFDDKGKFVTLVSAIGLIDFQVINNEIVYYQDGLIHFYDYITHSSRQKTLPKIEGIINAQISGNKLFLHCTDRILIYN